MLGAVYAVPAAVVAAGDDRQRGIALAVGVIPPAIVGLIPTRRGRLAIVVLGASVGFPMLLGGLLAGFPVLAVAAIVALGVGAALLAARSRLGMVAMNLSLPMVGVGLSYSEIGRAAALAGIMVLGAVFACAVTMLVPERPPPTAGTAPRAGARVTWTYGARLGAAGATAAAVGFLLDLEHVGWACAAALLVMRPAAEMQRLRSVGRILAVAIGALAAIAFLHARPSAGVYGLALLVVVAAAGGLHRSRWYVTPAFTTFLVFLLLLYSHPNDAAFRLDERLIESLIGVGIAYAFGLGLPALLAERDRGDRREVDPPRPGA